MDERLESSSHPTWLLIGFWGCVFIAVAVVVRRLVALILPSSGGPPQMAGLDESFAGHAGLTLFHIVPAAIFVILSACVLFRRSRAWIEALWFALGAVTGATAYAMSAYAIGGRIEQSAVLLFTSWFLWSLGRAYLCRRSGDRVRQRAWTVRAVGILLGIATTRPVMAVFFATSRLTHLSPHQFFGIAFWIGFTINALVTELWLRSAQRRKVATATHLK